MIHLVHGNKRDKVLLRSSDIVDRALKSNPDALYFKFSEENFDALSFGDLIGGRSLFSGKVVVLCDGILSNAEFLVFILKRLEEIASSSNVFIFRQDRINKKELEAFKSAEAKIEEWSDPEENRGYAGTREVKLKAGYENFNVFSFTDALGARDKKKAWVLYHKALRAGFPAEEMFWKAVWLFKNIVLVSSVNKNQKDLETKLKIKPYTLGNSRKFLKNYEKGGQFLEKYRDLVDIYHRFRRGESEVEMATEQFILNL